MSLWSKHEVFMDDSLKEKEKEGVQCTDVAGCKYLDHVICNQTQKWMFSDLICLGRKESRKDLM